MVDANFSRSFRRSDLHRKDVRILLDREKGMLADVELEAAHRRAQREVREAKTDRLVGFFSLVFF